MLNWNNALILPLPPIDPMAGQAKVLTSAFNTLRRSTRATFVSEIADKEQFSQVISSSVSISYESADPPLSRAAELFLKAPGSDFYLPSELAQFELALRAIIHHQYNSGKTRLENRSGQEFCKIYFAQGNVTREWAIKNDSLSSTPHMDLNPDMTTELGGAIIADRYIVYDGLPTQFFDFDLKISRNLARRRSLGAMHWTDMMERDAQRAVSKTFAPYSIVHFDDTTIHQAAIPNITTPRTFLTVTFSRRIPDEAQLQAMQTQNPRLRGFLLNG
jgi:hypothetical protein